MTYDLTILTDARYVNPTTTNEYIDHVLLEDRLVREALVVKGLKVNRINWDDPEFDWYDTRFILFRSTWDYFDRFAEFNSWLKMVRSQTRLINSYELIRWNINKSYLFELEQQGINIPPSLFIREGDPRSLREIVHTTSWDRVILKPAIAGAARHTYLFDRYDTAQFEDIFHTLIRLENLILQEYQHLISERGEIALMIFGGTYSHSVLKRAKPGDFRVQDDFGGTVHPYIASESEIEMAKKTLSACPGEPVYGRVDMMWNNEGELCLSEVELIEPELWFREDPKAAHLLADAILHKMKENGRS